MVPQGFGPIFICDPEACISPYGSPAMSIVGLAPVIFSTTYTFSICFEPPQVFIISDND